MPLTAAELREAIERPAEQIGLKFEQGVVEALVHDILGEPAALPCCSSRCCSCGSGASTTA